MFVVGPASRVVTPFVSQCFCEFGEDFSDEGGPFRRLLLFDGLQIAGFSRGMRSLGAVS